jgi:hypothetical protein
VGVNFGGSITNSYASGKVVSSGTNVGGLVGEEYGTVTDSFWDVDSTGQAAGVGTNNSTFNAVGKTTAELMTQSTYAGWDFTNTWWMLDTNTRPFFRFEYSTTINNAHQLQMMSMDLSASYSLANNIDLTSEVAAVGGQYPGVWSAQGFAPIGNATSQFTGSFNGLNHTITGLSINRSTDNIGLFGYTGTSSNISNIGLENGSVTGQSSVGGLVGYNSGTITNAYNAAGTVSASAFDAGGLVGTNHGTITNAYASSSVTGNIGDTGGLVGGNYGNISNAYAIGSVTGGSGDVGGIVGGNYGTGNINNVYATGFVSGTGNVGGLVGFVGGSAVVSNSVWDIDTSGQPAANGVGSNLGIFTALGYNTGDLMLEATYTSEGWNFSTDWWVLEGNTRPFLRSEYSTSIANAHQLQLMQMDV